jgi:hypothetical protein
VRKYLFSACLMLTLLVILPGFALSQDAQQNLTLLVNGQRGQATVVRINGRSYVEIEALARIVNGSLSFKENQIILALPASTTSAPPTQPENPAFSKEFLRAAIEEMAAIREWRIVLANAVQNGYPIAEDLLSPYRGQAAKGLSLASVAASTEYDRGGLKLLTNEFDNMEKLGNNILAFGKSRDYLAPDALDHDPLNQRILSCAHSLASMVASGRFEDDGTCY